MQGRIQLPYWPAALTLVEAAAYCGLNQRDFLENCTVRPIRFASSGIGERYLRFRIDEWLLSLERGSKLTVGEYTPPKAITPATPQNFTPATLAERWSCSERHVRNLINTGQLKSAKLGGKLTRIPLAFVEEYELGRSSASD